MDLVQFEHLVNTSFENLFIEYTDEAELYSTENEANFMVFDIVNNFKDIRHKYNNLLLTRYREFLIQLLREAENDEQRLEALEIINRHENEFHNNARNLESVIIRRYS